MLQLSAFESQVYYASSWYQERCKVRRARLVASGWITPKDQGLH